MDTKGLAVALILVAGALMLVQAVLEFGAYLYLPSYLSTITPGSAVYNATLGQGISNGTIGTVILFAAIFLLISSLILILSAVRIRKLIIGYRNWVILALAMSILAIFAGGGFFAGTIVGVVGSVLGFMSMTPSQPEPAKTTAPAKSKKK